MSYCMEPSVCVCGFIQGFIESKDRAQYYQEGILPYHRRTYILYDTYYIL